MDQLPLMRFHRKYCHTDRDDFVRGLDYDAVEKQSPKWLDVCREYPATLEAPNQPTSGGDYAQTAVCISVGIGVRYVTVLFYGRCWADACHEDQVFHGHCMEIRKRFPIEPYDRLFFIMATGGLKNKGKVLTSTWPSLELPRPTSALALPYISSSECHFSSLRLLRKDAEFHKSEIMSIISLCGSITTSAAYRSRRERVMAEIHEDARRVAPLISATFQIKPGENNLGRMLELCDKQMLQLLASKDPEYLPIAVIKCGFGFRVQSLAGDQAPSRYSQLSDWLDEQRLVTIVYPSKVLRSSNWKPIGPLVWDILEKYAQEEKVSISWLRPQPEFHFLRSAKMEEIVMTGRPACDLEKNTASRGNRIAEEISKANHVASELKQRNKSAKKKNVDLKLKERRIRAGICSQ